MSYYHRILETELNKMLGNFPVIALVGPRQVGKSTLLSHISRTHHLRPYYVSLDNPLLAAEANSDPERFLSSFPRPLIIDEFQYAPTLTSYIKIEIDKARDAALFENRPRPDTLFFLTGSQFFDLMDTIRESLAGRVGILNLYNFSTREIEKSPSNTPFTPVYDELKSHTPTKHLTERELYARILRGGYPELIANPNLDSRQYFSSYLQTYIERDIRRLIRPSREYDFTRFVSLLAARTGQQLIIDHLASELRLDSKTASSWLSLLRSTGLVYLLSPYFNNDTKRISKKPKLYFTDTGLACYLAGYPSLDGLMNSSFRGQIFETHVIMEIVKSYINAGLDPAHDLYYYRHNDRQECDLLIRYQNSYYPIEIKSSANPTLGDARWLSSPDIPSAHLADGLILCRASSPVPISDRLRALPIEYI